MTWLSITIAGILTYLTRMTMIALVRRDLLGEKIKAVLAYVPSAVFPAIIFPAIFINDYGAYIEMNDPKIFGAFVAIIVGYFSKNVVATIFFWSPIILDYYLYFLNGYVFKLAYFNKRIPVLY
jgi:branched-subunit amino acid transport protein